MSDDVLILNPERMLHVYSPPYSLLEEAVISTVEQVNDWFPNLGLGGRAAVWLINRRDDVSVVCDFKHVLGPHHLEIQRLDDYNILKITIDREMEE